MKKVQMGVSAIHFAQTLHFQILYTYFFKNIRHLQCDYSHAPGDLKVDYPIMTFFEKRKTIFFMPTDQQHSWFNYTRFNRMKLPDLSRNSLL